MCGLIAHRIGIDFGRAYLVKKAQRETVAYLRKCPRIMGLHDTRAAAFRDGRRQPPGDFGQSFFPRNPLKLTVAFRAGPPLRILQPGRRVPPDPVISESTFAAKSAPVVRVGGISHDLQNDAVLLDHMSAAGIVAVARAGRSNDFFQRRQHYSTRIISPCRIVPPRRTSA